MSRVNLNEYRPEQWLLFSNLLMDDVRTGGVESDSLCHLRLTAGLVRIAQTEDLEDEIRKAVESGQTCLHLVFGQLEEQFVARVHPFVRAGIEIRLHDWYDCPSAVTDSLNCPDASLIAALRHKLRQPQAPALRLAATPALAPDFQVRLMAGLRRWEREFREDFIEEFEELFGLDALPWDALLPMPAPALSLVARPAAGPSVAERIVGTLRGFVTALQELVPDPKGVAHAQAMRAAPAPLGGAPDSGDLIKWEFKADGNILIVEVVLSGHDPKAYVQYTGPGDPPAGVNLSFTTTTAGVWQLPLKPEWVRHLGQEHRSSGQLFADPRQALRRWLKHLKAHATQVEADLVDKTAGIAPEGGVAILPAEPLQWLLEGEGMTLHVNASRAGDACLVEVDLLGHEARQLGGIVMTLKAADERWDFYLEPGTQTIVDPVGALMAWLTHLRSGEAPVARPDNGVEGEDQ